MSETPSWLQNQGRRTGRFGDPKVIAKTGRHKAQRVILTENAEAIIERKLGWDTGTMTIKDRLPLAPTFYDEKSNT